MHGLTNLQRCVESPCNGPGGFNALVSALDTTRLTLFNQPALIIFETLALPVSFKPHEDTGIAGLISTCG